MAHPQPQGKDSLAQVATSSPAQQQVQVQVQESTVVVSPTPAPPPAEAVDSSAQDHNNTSPPLQRQEVTIASMSPEAVFAMIAGYKFFQSEELYDLRGWLMVLATLTASITWNASINPPGGVWQADDDAKGYVTGTSVYHDKNRAAYRLFDIFNRASFVSSLYMLILLSNTRLFRRTNALVFSVLVSLDLVGLMATFMLGSVQAYPHLTASATGWMIAELLLTVIVLALVIGPGIRRGD